MGLTGPVTARHIAGLAAIAMAPVDALLADQRRQTESLERRLGIIAPERRAETLAGCGF